MVSAGIWRKIRFALLGILKDIAMTVEKCYNKKDIEKFYIRDWSTKMGFTTSTFFFMFMPVMVVVYFTSFFLNEKFPALRKIRIRDCALVLLSAFFYAWACESHVLWLALYIVLIYFMGALICKTRDLYLKLPVYRKEGADYHQIRMLPIGTAAFFLAILMTISVLVRYKYADFLNDNFSYLGITFPRGTLAMAPLGISFIVFSSVSYLADVKQGKAELGSLLDCAMYLTFFPKIVSGPIVLWRDFKPQIRQNQPSLERVISGINRISIGFAKKALLADVFGLTIAQIDHKGTLGMDTGTVWIAVILYMLQIYYDFAGYSDIAIGLTRVLGFECKENFNFPYRSLSITEFWKRWHISLGAWFREYVYIPMGGNRKGLGRTLLNLGVVFALTGIWHGASWKYMIWGAINGILVIAERIYMKKPLYQKVPAVIKWAGTMFVVMLFWQFFRFPLAKDAYECIGRMFRPGSSAPVFGWRYFLDTKLLVLMCTGILGATVLGSPRIKNCWQKVSGTRAGFAVQESVLIILLMLSVIAIVSSTYSPFIYFQY